MPLDMESMVLAYPMYSAGIGSLPRMEATAASSPEARYRFAPWPRRLGKFRVEADTAVDFGASVPGYPCTGNGPSVFPLSFFAMLAKCCE